jgi:hypothetical protein
MKTTIIALCVFLACTGVAIAVDVDWTLYGAAENKERCFLRFHRAHSAHKLKQGRSRYRNFLCQVAAPAVSATITNIRPYADYVNNSSAFDIGSGGSTYANLLVLIGTGPPNASIPIYNNDSQIGAATANANGNWTFTTGDPQASTSLIAADGAQSFTAANSVAYNVTINPNITNFSTTPNSTFYLNGFASYNQSAGQPWSIQYNAANHDIRFELRSGDHWPSDYNNSTEQRTNISIANLTPNQIVDFSFEWMVEAGSPVTNGWGQLFFELMQNAPDGATAEPYFALNVNAHDDQIYWSVMAPSPPGLSTHSGWSTYYTWNSPTEEEGHLNIGTVNRGHWYAIHIRLRPNDSGAGFCQVWVDGTQVLNYTGNIGVTTSNHTFPNLSIYRGNNTMTTVSHIRNFLIAWPGT